MTKDSRIAAVVDALVVAGMIAFATPLVWFVIDRVCVEPEPGPDAVVLTKSGTVTAQWNYQQLPMKECRWCGRTVNLNRHHAVPQAANPALRDVRENLIVLCRDCHFVLGHRCNWKQYNPDVMYIATHFTNVVRSADTRYAVTNGTQVADRADAPAGADGLLHVTNDVPASQRDALERILRSGTDGKRAD